jgi:hypothetical protein
VRLVLVALAVIGVASVVVEIVAHAARTAGRPMAVDAC